MRVGIGGPVGTGKTALMDALCKVFRDEIEIAAITNDIYTKEDAEFLTRAGSLPPERILGIETGGCPHTAIREDASINLAGVAANVQAIPRAGAAADRKRRRQSGRDLLARNSPISPSTSSTCRPATRSRAKAARASPSSDLLVINKIDLAPLVGASLEVMDRDAKRMRGDRPFIFANVKAGQGTQEIARFIAEAGGLRKEAAAF